MRHSCLSSVICLLFFAAVPVITAGQTHYQLGFGTTNILDTYLSQEKFSGVGLSLLSTNERFRDSCRWSLQWQHQLHASTADDRADNSSLMEGMYKFYFGGYYQLFNGGKGAGEATPQLYVGVLGNVGIGMIYNTRNGNNPVQARLGMHIMPSAKATYALRLFHHPAKLRYQLDLPLAGLVFSPNYGQSYYEMFSLGNYDHNIVPTTFVSAPNFRQQLALLYTVSPSFTFSIGYLGDYQQQHVNNLKQHVYNHVVMVGIAKKYSFINP